MQALHFWWYIICVLVQIIFFGAFYSAFIGGQLGSLIVGLLFLTGGFWWMLIALKHPEMWGCIEHSVQMWIFTIVVLIQTVLSGVSCLQAFQVGPLISETVNPIANLPSSPSPPPTYLKEVYGERSWFPP